jgi:hypothetical protein
VRRAVIRHVLRTVTSGSRHSATKRHQAQENEECGDNEPSQHQRKAPAVRSDKRNHDQGDNGGDNRDHDPGWLTGPDICGSDDAHGDSQNHSHHSPKKGSQARTSRLTLSRNDERAAIGAHAGFVCYELAAVAAVLNGRTSLARSVCMSLTPKNRMPAAHAHCASVREPTISDPSR